MKYEQVYKIIKLYNKYKGCLDDDGTVVSDEIITEWIVANIDEPIDKEELADIKEAGYLTLWNKNKQNVEPGSETYTKDDIMEAIEIGYRKGVER